MDASSEEVASQQLEKRLDALYQLADRLATLSAGALALTVTFRKDLGGSSSEHLWALKTSWVGFILAVIGFLLVYLGRVEIHRRLAENAITSSSAYAKALPPWYAKVGKILLVVGFLAGLLLLAFFGAVN